MDKDYLAVVGREPWQLATIEALRNSFPASGRAKAIRIESDFSGALYLNRESRAKIQHALSGECGFIHLVGFGDVHSYAHPVAVPFLGWWRRRQKIA